MGQGKGGVAISDYQRVARDNYRKGKNGMEKSISTRMVVESMAIGICPSQSRVSRVVLFGGHGYTWRNWFVNSDDNRPV